LATSAIEKYMTVIEAFTQKPDRILTAHDPILTERLKLSTRQIDRILKELEAAFDAIVRIEKTRPIQYKLTKPIDLLEKAFENSDELGWLYELVKEKDPEVFAKLGDYSKHTDHIYQFQNTPFEDLERIETKQTFERLKSAVRNREYRNLFFHDGKKFEDVKCLKLLFLEGNWYIAFVISEDKLKLGRISFIKEVRYSQKTSSFQPKSVTKHLRFLKEELQNPFTLFGHEKKKATLKALPSIAHYFEEGMKPFLSSQQFIRKEKDDSVVFEVTYTQPLEILPLIQKWMPDLIILKPQSLQNHYVEKLQQTIQNNTTTGKNI